jgi:putative peptidoglycan lipid II flippase
MLGNLGSSLLGVLRLRVVTALFGQTSQVGAFFAALKTPQQLSDLLVGGAVAGIFIPLFARASARDETPAFEQILSTLLTLILLVMAGAALLLAVAAPFVVPLLNAGFAPSLQSLTVRCVVIVSPMLVASGLCAVLGAALFALKRSFIPALAAGLVHLGVIAGAIAGARWWGVPGLAAGMALGTTAQAACLALALHRARVPLRLGWNLSHPALATLRRMYPPIALGMLASLGMQMIDQFLQSQVVDPTTGARGGPAVAALASATQLIQFPAGIITAAIAFAVLPDLARAREHPIRFRMLLRHGMLLGVALMVPAMLAFFWIGSPIVALLFQHGAFHVADTARTTLALRGYAGELPFLAIEQVGITACMALGAPRVPLIAGVLSIAAYLAVALPQTTHLSVLTLALANAALHAANASFVLGWLVWRLGPKTRLLQPALRKRERQDQRDQPRRAKDQAA